MIERKWYKRTDDMKTSTKSILPLLIVIISVFTGVAIANEKNVINMTNVTNVTIGPNATVVTPTSIVTPIVTVYPNVTMPITTPVVTPNVTITPNITVSITTPLATPIVTITPNATPNIVVTPVETVPILVTNPNVTVVPTVTVQAPVVTPDVIIEHNTTVIYVPITDGNATRQIISDGIVETPYTRKQPHMPKQTPISTQTAVPIPTVEMPANSNQNSFFGDISDKIIIGAILGLVGLFYEIVKIKYEHKHKAKVEKINEDTQNKLLERLEKRQEELLAKHRNSLQQDALLNRSEKQQQQAESLNRPEKQQEDINDENKTV